MGSTELLNACIAALVAVFVVLILLSIVIRVLIAVFPERKHATDTQLLAAVSSAASAAYPGMHVTKIEEEK